MRDICSRCGATRIDQQIGLEPTPDEWAARLVAVFREARRVLRADGSLWVECGDSYAGGNKGGQRKDSWALDGSGGNSTWGAHRIEGDVPSGLKPKDLIGQPFLLAFALRADGWYWRGCNIWAKPNAMPESAKDRCTVAHSYVLHFSKSARYFFDGDAIREPNAPDYQGLPDPSRVSRLNTLAKREAYEETVGEHMRARGSGGNTGIRDSGANTYNGLGKNPRSVWTISTQGFPEAHFATWPEALARRIILAAVPEWVCEVCGKARERIREADSPEPRPLATRKGMAHVPGNVPQKDGSIGNARYRAVGFTDCGHDAYRPGVVLDPFAGSGTTAYVARKLGRRAIGIELNESYLEMAARRLQQQSLFADGIA